jgi:hypothetical protein
MINKKKLHDRFTASMEALGVYWGDDETGMNKEEWVAAGGDPEKFDEDSIALLPGGGALGICTFGADYVIKTLGQGHRYGFLVEDNPKATDPLIDGAGGHDFALIAGRFIVDPWYAMTQNNAYGVYDLTSAIDRRLIESVYGDPACWKWYDPEAQESISMLDKNLPPALFVSYPPLKKYEPISLEL